MECHVAVIGAGHWGKNFVRNLTDMGVLGMVCDADMSRAAIVSPGVRFVTDADDVFADPTIQAVVIATPAPTHFALAREAIRRGKDVLVEKPMCMQAAQGEELCALAEAHHRVLMVGHLLHYHPAVRSLKELVQSGDLGEIRSIHAERLNFGRFRPGVDALWSFAPHDVSLALSLLQEEPENVMSHGISILMPGVADITFSHCVFPSGAHLSMHISWLHPAKVQRFVVMGSKKIAVFDDLQEQKLLVYPYSMETEYMPLTGGSGQADGVAYGTSEPLREECEHFLSCVKARTTPLTDGREGVEVLRMLDACQRSMQSHTRVSLSS